MHTINVLCVENHAENLQTLRFILERAGYKVISASTGEQGVSMLKRQPIEGVLLEYDLPDATGATVRAEMNRIKPEIPILLFAGVGSQTPFLIKFFDSYLRNAERPAPALDA